MWLPVVIFVCITGFTTCRVSSARLGYSSARARLGPLPLPQLGSTLAMRFRRVIPSLSMDTNSTDNEMKILILVGSVDGGRLPSSNNV